VASQALITASFNPLSQVMNLSYFPHIKVVHTSKKFHGQIYIPLANWLLMIGCVIVTAAYNNTTKLGNAYGVCVIFVTFITTSMVSLVAIIIWRINVFIVASFFLTCGALDGVYSTSLLDWRKSPRELGSQSRWRLSFLLFSCFGGMERSGSRQ